MDILEASEIGELECIKTLLSKGINANTQDEDGRTALFTASERGYYDVVKYLLEHGAAADGEEMYMGWTPLMIASYAGHFKIVKLLLRYGANINKKNKGGWTAFKYAEACGRRSVMLLLHKHHPFVEKGINTFFNSI